MPDLGEMPSYPYTVLTDDGWELEVAGYSEKLDRPIVSSWRRRDERRLRRLLGERVVDEDAPDEEVCLEPMACDLPVMHEGQHRAQSRFARRSGPRGG